MKIIITGASGLLGREIYKKLAQTHTVIGCAFSRANDNLIKLDLTNAADVTSFISQEKPDVVIHTAAERKPEICDKATDQAAKLNVSATETLAKLSKQLNFNLIYISTDYVFNGSNPPYNTQSETSPINSYGKLKLEGEIKALTSPYAAVLRVPILYGPTNSLEEGAVTIIAKNLLNGNFSQDNWAIRYPTLTSDVANAISKILPLKLSGIFHFSASVPYTKYSMALVCAKILKIDQEKIIPVNNPSYDTLRPYNCQLDCSKLTTLIGHEETNFTLAMTQILKNQEL